MNHSKFNIIRFAKLNEPYSFPTNKLLFIVDKNRIEIANIAFMDNLNSLHIKYEQPI